MPVMPVGHEGLGLGDAFEGVNQTPPDGDQDDGANHSPDDGDREQGGHGGGLGRLVPVFENVIPIRIDPGVP